MKAKEKAERHLIKSELYIKSVEAIDIALKEQAKEIFKDLDEWLEEEYKTDSLFFDEYDKIKQKHMRKKE